MTKEWYVYVIIRGTYRDNLEICTDNIGPFNSKGSAAIAAEAISGRVGGSMTAYTTVYTNSDQAGKQHD